MVEGAAYTKSSVRRETRAPGRVAEVRGCGQSEAVVAPVVALVVDGCGAGCGRNNVLSLSLRE